MEPTGAEALQQGKGQRHQETQQSLRSKACRCRPLRGGRGVRKAAATALQEWVCVVSPTTGLALLALMAPPPSHNRKTVVLRDSSWGPAGACSSTRSPCVAWPQILLHPPWPGGGRKFRSRGGRRPWLGPGQLEVSGSVVGHWERSRGFWSLEEVGLAVQGWPPLSRKEQRC